MVPLTAGWEKPTQQQRPSSSKPPWRPAWPLPLLLRAVWMSARPTDPREPTLHGTRMGQTPGGKQRQDPYPPCAGSSGWGEGWGGGRTEAGCGSRPLRVAPGSEETLFYCCPAAPERWPRKPGFLLRQSLTTFTVSHTLTGQHSLTTSVQINFLVKQILENLILLLLI